MNNRIGSYIAQRRRELGFTQQKLAEKLNISFQAVSKWENGSASPDIGLLPQLAYILNTTADALVGYSHQPFTHYEQKYKEEDYYWGLSPNELCYEIMKLCPPIRPYRVLDIGCGEGKDAVFLAKNGYRVTAFDVAEAGLDKARDLAQKNQVHIDLFQANVNEYFPDETYDIVFSSGVLHYISFNKRQTFFDSLKAHTNPEGICALNVFVAKPFLEPASDMEETERSVEPWHSGELAGYYHDWLFHKNEEIVFDCSSGGIPHKHCMNVIIAQKINGFGYGKEQ